MFGKPKVDWALCDYWMTTKPTAKEFLMLLDNLYKITALAVVCLIVAPANGQVVDRSQQPASPATLTADGQLTGSVIVANATNVDKAPATKVSLVSQGKVIDSVTTDAAGQFSFANVHPGPYKVVGAAPGFVGSAALAVGPFAAPQPAVAQPAAPKLVLQQSSAAGVYNSYSSMPLSTMSTSAPSVGYGGGGGIGGGLGGGRLLGRGILSSPRGLLIVGGITGGVVAAIDDSSPDQ